MLTKEQATKLMKAANRAGWEMKPVSEVKEKALNGALRSYASGVRREDVFAVFDTTVFGGGKTGFLLTAEALYNDSFATALKRKGTTSRLPLAGIQGVKAVAGSKYDYTVTYRDGSSIEIYTYSGELDGLLALLRAAIRMEKEAAAEPAPAPEPEQPAQEDETARLLAEYQARLNELAQTVKAAEAAKAEAEAKAAAEAKARAEAEAKAKAEAEAKARAEAEAKAKAEAEAKARAEAEAKAKAAAEAKAKAQAAAKAKQPAPAEKPEDQLTNDERNERGLALYRAGDYEAAYRVLSPICPTRRLKLGNMKYPAAQVAMGWMRENGRGTDVNESFALRHYSFAADWDDRGAMRDYLRLYRKKQKPTDYDDERALRYAQALADAGDAEAKAVLPQLKKKAQEAEARKAYDEGMKHYQAKEYEQAASLFEKAARLGHARAQFCLGACYENGQGVAQDKAKAADWWEQAAQQGYASGQRALGICYAFGRGVRQDRSKAIQWYEKAAQQGDAQAQYNLGVCYYTGQGVTRNRTKAKEWFQKAAAQGDEDARKVLREYF